MPSYLVCGFFETFKHFFCKLPSRKCWNHFHFYQMCELSSITGIGKTTGKIGPTTNSTPSISNQFLIPNSDVIIFVWLIHFSHLCKQSLMSSQISDVSFSPSVQKIHSSISCRKSERIQISAFSNPNLKTLEPLVHCFYLARRRSFSLLSKAHTIMCTLDSDPFSLLWKINSWLLSSLPCLFNYSLSTGFSPWFFKHVLLLPIKR